MGCGAFFPKGNFFFLGGALGLGLGPALATMVLTTLSLSLNFFILVFWTSRVPQVHIHILLEFWQQLKKVVIWQMCEIEKIN